MRYLALLACLPLAACQSPAERRTSDLLAECAQHRGRYVAECEALREAVGRCHGAPCVPDEADRRAVEEAVAALENVLSKEAR